MMLISHKTKIYPNKSQQTMLNKTIGVNRYAYNYALNLWNREYEKFTKGIIAKKPNKLSIKKQINKLKKIDFPFCLEVSKFAVESAILDLAKGFDNFYKSKAKHPVFHKKGINDSFRVCSSDAISIKDKKVLIPKIGYVKMAENIRFSGTVKQATFSKKAGNYYVSFSIDTTKKFTQTKSNNAIGIDLGIREFCLSNGQRYTLPKSYYKHQAELKRRQKALSRKYENAKSHNLKLQNCKNYQKQKIKLQKTHSKISNIRNDFLHKLSTGIMQNYKLISIENLNVKGMSKNHYLAKSILDSGFYEFRRQLEYKSKLYGNKIFINDRYYPSSKLCSICGKKTNRLKNISTLNIRNWQCDKCQTNHDRDINASVNLVKNAVSSTVSACGEFYTADLDTQYLNQVSSIEAGRKHQMNTFE